MQNFPDETGESRGFGDRQDPAPEPNEDGSIDATEEEQMQYDLLTVRARKMIFGPSKEKVLTMLGSSESPAKAIGQAGAMILKGLVDAAEAKGMAINSDVVSEAGSEVADDLNELGKSAGVFQFEDQAEEDAQMEEAMLWGAKFYGDGTQASNQLTPELQKTAEQLTVEGLAGDDGSGGQTKQTPIAAGVSQAMAPPPQSGGLVSGNMAQPPAGGV
jgi:hypothetical protein